MPSTRDRRPRALLCLTLLLSLGCPKRDQDVSTQPDHDHGDHHGHGDHEGHEGHHGHEGQHGHEGHHGVNEHGYKGHRFDDPAEWMDHFESPERAAWQRPDELVASLKLAADAKIADLGAGTGYFAVRFASVAAKGQVYAVDIEAGMVEFLGQRASDEGLDNLVAIQGEADDPKLPEAVDLVFMCNVFHHLADPSAYFSAVAAKLLPGGRVVIVDFRKDNPDDAPGPPAAMRMSSEQIRAAMESAGYALEREDRELLEYQYVLEFRRAG